MSDNPWWLNNALVDVSKLNRFPDDDPGDWAAKIRAEAAKEKWTPLLPPDYYSKNPAVNTALSTLLGPLPWLRDPDKPDERMQLWPERMTRSALTLPEDVMTGRTPIYDPETGHVNPEFIDRVQDMSGLIMSGTAFSAPRGSLGTGPARPPAAAEPRAPTFFTGLERELLSTKRGENAAPESGTMADWQEYLGKRVKPDEMKWLLRPESVDPKQRFSRQEIAERVAVNKPQEHWKGETDKDPMSIQHDFASDVLDKWRSSPPIFRAEPIAAGYSNIVDQYGYIAERHVSNMETKGRIMDLDKIVNEYKKSLEPLSTPEATANAADRRMQAEDDLFQLSLDVASNHMPKENVVYGPEDYPSYTLPGGENYREVVVTLPEPAHDPQIIRDYHQLENDIKYGDAALERANSELHNVENALRTAREQPADVRLRNAAALQKLERNRNTYQSRREQLTEQIERLEKQHQEMMPAYEKSVAARDSQYTSSHWEEKNALAHARMDDRNIPGIGKTLTVQEVQSDWHQAGQKNKYAGDPSLVQYEQVREARRLQEEIGHTLEQSIQKAQPHLISMQAERMATQLLEKHEHGGGPDHFFTPEENALARQWVEAGDHHRRLAEAYGDQKVVPDAPFKATWPDMMLKRLLRKAIDEGYDAISWVPGAEHARRYKQEVRGSEGSEIRWSRDGTVTVDSPSTRGVVEIAKDIKTREDLTKLFGESNRATEQDIVSELMDHRIEGHGTRVQLDEPRTFYTQRGRRMQSFYDKQLVDKMNAIVGKYGAKVEKTPLKNEAETKQLYEKEATDQYQRGYKDLDPNRQKQIQEDAAKKYGIREVFVVKLNDKMRRDVQSKGFPLFSGGLIPVDHNPFDYDWNKSKAGDLTNRTMMRGDWQPQKMTGDEWMRSLQNNSVPGSNRR